ncbi:putative arsenite transmembrane transporter protein [Thermochaetoides thermophila DSM 1495]|uniref:Putative arsenite transmembrane transporter protein n=1 Tax=Chaetomium thermophilum (strain DSM 1495 / CBS 144.50 / IMI 039719) TaxID=759272 RepID=G0SAA4_CHATD|nr:putative arsenite transmembrane transporter protein [Thermochaetoides thermophila DSM 1495]EGS19676.1 putative arsenite transmembrane transporter protein [Thermochaetoides thermophila DSM 1495]
MAGTAAPPDYNQIKNWRSIVTLIVFVATNIIVLFPFHIPIYVPRRLYKAILGTLSSLRVIPPQNHDNDDHVGLCDDSRRKRRFVRFNFPLNLVTAPLIADLFLLAILAIGRQEVKEGTLGTNHISPLDIMLFFITLAYIAISLDASGIIRFLAFKVLQWGGEVGHRLFFFLYVFFFVIASFVGNDPVILSGTAFLAYMWRVSNNITHPRAWIYTQFAVANIASAILVSSNPTNLVLAGAFQIKFVEYTANMIVPVIITGVLLFPFLLYVRFANQELIPHKITMHQLPQELRDRKPVNPNIPNAKGVAEQQEDETGEQEKLLSLEEIMNPFLDKRGAAFGAIIMAVTLIAVLALNAAKTSIGEQPVYYITLPAATVMFVWDLAFGWINRHETRRIAREGRKQLERARMERRHQQKEENQNLNASNPSPNELTAETSSSENTQSPDAEKQSTKQEPATLVSLAHDAYGWCQETFPTAMAVLAHLPFALVPFAFSMFVLVQALVTKGWVQIFALGWDKWVRKTGTIGAIWGMGLVSVVLCNFSGTNIGTTILLSRVLQSWLDIHRYDGTPISKRTFWATIYTMALGVNYGAFSTALSASLAGLLWSDILEKKHIPIKRQDFAMVNFPIIAIAMAVGCLVLIGEVYITRDTTPMEL